jgi:hypothetical protein
MLARGCGRHDSCGALVMRSRPATTLLTMPEGEYVPSASQWVRDQVEEFERSDGQRANTLRDTGLPIVVVTMRGNKSGAVRKIALMRAG